MVFQSFGLYPHLRARENIAFPLKLAKVDNQVIEQRLTEMTQLLGIDQLMKRRLNELSGGERQRVAIAKALVKRPRLFLLDEPFSNLDAEMRRQLRGELVRIHQKLETTTIFVTHDQEEAMAVADRVAIMRAGEMIQIGEPLDLYNRPRNMWVARFIGSHPINMIDISVMQDSSKVLLFVEDQTTLEVPADFYDKARRYKGKDLILGIRPEFIRIQPGKASKGQIQSRVFTRQVLGNQILYELRVGSDLLRAVVPSTENYPIDADVVLDFAWSHALTFDKATEQCLLN
jgi:multiple sugar transport system ATP-binding protein